MAHPNGKTMSSIGFSKHGKTSELAKNSVAYPHGFDARNNIVIKVHAAAVNPVDKALLSGDLKMVFPVATFPHVISYDVAGVVEEADLEGKFSVGQPVFARLFGSPKDGKKTPWYRGAMAEYCVADTSNVVLKPENLSFEEAASIPLVGMTALQVLKASGLKEGDSIFISGGAGGVGTMAIQLAKHVFKASRVVTTASKGEKEKLCKSLGADVVVDYKTSNFVEVYGGTNADKFDVCFDTTGESLQMSSIVNDGGRIVTIAGMATLEELRRIGGTAWILKLFVKRKAKRKEHKAAQSVNADWNYLFLSPSHADLSTLASHLKSGAIKPVLDGVWDFHSEDDNDGWKGAFNRSFSGRAMGKCVVKIV
ncbi:MAG: NADP-dependent oxidoreductase [Candidatus Poseidoniales archaeon]|nr:MAG: NADP-dependent oxidoreductase [Candidatus Poseidoniales archaeon]